MQVNRIRVRGRIDRNVPLAFSFDGRKYEGFRGDTLASALLANGRHLVARSFKYHRPRGILSAGPEEPCALVQLEAGAYTRPNTRATVVELYDGLAATSQNCWPGVAFDIGAINDLLSRFLVAGFYYKTFMWPPGWWQAVYEPILRKAAGLGRAPVETDPDSYEHVFAHCDILVIGAGPAGIAAAIAAGRTGARVMLADAQSEPGGMLLTDGGGIDNRPAMEWVWDSLSELALMKNVEVLPRTTVTGYYDHNFLTALEQVTTHLRPGSRPGLPGERLWKIRAREVIIATGAIERPPLFAGNDRPGIMLASAARTYIDRYGVLPGRRLVVFTNNSDAYRTALAAHDAGCAVEIVDLRRSPPGPDTAGADAAGIPVHQGCVIAGTTGRRGVSGCRIARFDAETGRAFTPHRSLSCDAIACSAGWNPAVHLWSQARGTLSWDRKLACFVPGSCQQRVRAAGACNGTFGLGYCLLEGGRAGSEAARDAGFGAGRRIAPAAANAGYGLEPAFLAPAPRSGAAGKCFVDIQNDVTVADIRLAADEGYRSVEHLKRYTTTGMGTDQGKTSNVNALAVMAGIRGITIPEMGTTTFRPPYVPVGFGAIAGPGRGRFFRLERRTPMHEWHEANGASFSHSGEWLRPWAYPGQCESPAEAVQREALAARTTAGLFDASTLGKIDLRGPDSVEFLNRIYTNSWSDLKPGHCRYGLMLNERGMVFDDGVTTRLGKERFHMTTTTGNAEATLAWLEEWLQTKWPDLRVYLTDMAEQWAVAVLCGPKARAVLCALTGMDVGREAFPFMTFRVGKVAGIPARVFRIGFSGELSYEINVPASYGLCLWKAIIERGRGFGLTPIGTEALHLLRAEKGFVLVGQDTDGTVTPLDLGMGRAVGTGKSEFIGRRSLSLPDVTRKGRLQLVGLKTADPEYVLPQGVHLAERRDARPPCRTIGHVTSSYMSPNLGRSIALALVKDGRERIGERAWALAVDGHVEPVEISRPGFLDAEGRRANG